MRQKGFTLIEVAVAMAVGGLIMMGVVLSISQVAFGTARTNSQVVALTDAHQAALQIKKDLQMAQSTNMTDLVPQSSVALSWTDFTGWATEENRAHSANYTVSDTNLLRTYDGTESIVGRHITSIEFTRKGKVITVTITATGPGPSERQETLEFTINTYLRPDGS